MNSTARIVVALSLSNAFTLLVLWILPTGTSAQQPATAPATNRTGAVTAGMVYTFFGSDTEFILRESNGPSGLHKYSIFLPRDLDPARKFPAIVFLHGIGEAGNDGKRPTTVGIGPVIDRRNGDFPFIVIFPQSGMDWTSTRSEQIVLDTITDATANYPGIDVDRISLTGISSGGKGTWVLGARHPEIFSALVPMAGFSAVDEVPRLTRIPIWALHNGDDWVVKVSNTHDMISRLQAAGGNPRFTIYENSGNGTNCWDQAYDEGALFAWLQAQRLSSVARGSIK